MTVHHRPLRIAAHVELVTLLALLANLATGHFKVISSMIGPNHGFAHLFAVFATLRHDQAAPAATATTLLPGVGSLLALRQLTPTTPTTSHIDKAARP